MIRYERGDATEPKGENNLVIHIVNDIGVFGAGFAKAVADKYPIVRDEYLEWSKSEEIFHLGEVQFVKVNKHLVFCNMVAQSGVRGKANPTPIRYDAVRKCLRTIRIFIKESGMNVCSNRFGSGLSGGAWSETEKIIDEELTNHGIQLTVYDLR